MHHSYSNRPTPATIEAEERYQARIASYRATLSNKELEQNKMASHYYKGRLSGVVLAGTSLLVCTYMLSNPFFMMYGGLTALYSLVRSFMDYRYAPGLSFWKYNSSTGKNSSAPNYECTGIEARINHYVLSGDRKDVTLAFSAGFLNGVRESSPVHMLTSTVRAACLILDIIQLKPRFYATATDAAWRLGLHSPAVRKEGTRVWTDTMKVIRKHSLLPPSKRLANYGKPSRPMLMP